MPVLLFFPLNIPNHAVERKGCSFSELGPDATLASTFAMASEQASKMQMGPNSMITSFFNNFTLVQFDCNPLVVTVIAKPGDGAHDLGGILGARKEVYNALGPLRNVLEDLKNYGTNIFVRSLITKN